MILYGCAAPALFNVWACGGMTQYSRRYAHSMYTCKGEARPLYAWALNADELKLPDGNCKI